VLRRFRSSLVQHPQTLLQSFAGKQRRQDIAKGFRISEHTVKHHLSNVFDKLGVSTRLELGFVCGQSRIALENDRLEPYGTLVPYAIARFRKSVMVQFEFPQARNRFRPVGNYMHVRETNKSR
jgi:hypothetical protein